MIEKNKEVSLSYKKILIQVLKNSKSILRNTVAFFVLSSVLSVSAVAGESFKGTDDIFWTLELELAEGKDDVFENLISEMVASTRKEKGAKVYEIYRNGNIVYFLDRYDSNKDADIHLDNFSSKFAERFLAILTPIKLTVFGPVNEKVRKKLEGLGPQFFNQVNGFER